MRWALGRYRLRNGNFAVVSFKDEEFLYGNDESGKYITWDISSGHCLNIVPKEVGEFKKAFDLVELLKSERYDINAK